MNETERALLFWLVCMPTRTLIAAAALQRTHDVPLRLGASIIGYRWLVGMESEHVGAFGGPAWWAEERALHGAMWAVYAVTGRGEFLVADTVFGAYNWATNAYSSRGCGLD